MPPGWDVDWDVEADVVVVGFGAAGACAALEAAAAGPFGAGPRPVHRRRGHGPVRRRRLRRRRHAAAARGRVSPTRPRRCSATCAPRSATPCPGRNAPRVLRRQRGHAGLAGGPRRAVRGEPVPGQDLVSDQPPLPVLLRQRAVRRRRGAARAAAATGPAAAAPRAGCCTRGWPRPSAGAGVRVLTPDRRASSWSPSRVPAAGLPAWSAGPCAARPAGPGSRTVCCTAGRPSRTCTHPRSAGSCTSRWLAGAAVRAAAAGRGGVRGGAGRGRFRRQPADDARARADRARRPAAGHARRRRQRHPARHRSRRRDGVPGPGLRSGGSSARPRPC